MVIRIRQNKEVTMFVQAERVETVSEKLHLEQIWEMEWIRMCYKPKLKLDCIFVNIISSIYRQKEQRSTSIYGHGNIGKQIQQYWPDWIQISSTNSFDTYVIISKTNLLFSFHLINKIFCFLSINYLWKEWNHIVFDYDFSLCNDHFPTGNRRNDQ